MVNGLQGSRNHNEEQMGTHKHSNHLAPSGSSNSSSNFSFKIKAQDQSNIQIRNDVEPVHNPFNKSKGNDHITHTEAATVTTQVNQQPLNEYKNAIEVAQIASTQEVGTPLHLEHREPSGMPKSHKHASLNTIDRNKVEAQIQHVNEYMQLEFDILLLTWSAKKVSGH